MSNKISDKAQKVYEFFRKNPSASASAIAAKHKMSISNVYKMRARALEDLRNFVAPEMLPMPEVKSSWQQIVEEVESVNVDKTLNARAEMYGKFKDGAALMQSIKRELSAHAGKHNKTFADDQWVDIAGYATLIADRLEGNAR